MTRDETFMARALEEARQAAREGEVPVGAVVVTETGRIVGRAHNLTEALGDVTAHAEMLALTAAARTLGGKYLTDCTLYVTVEPCAMCAGAIGWAQTGRVVWGAPDPRRGFTSMLRTPDSGGEGPTPLHPRTLVTAGVMADECTRLMREFFAARRVPKKS